MTQVDARYVYALDDNQHPLRWTRAIEVLVIFRRVSRRQATHAAGYRRLRGGLCHMGRSRNFPTRGRSRRRRVHCPTL